MIPLWILQMSGTAGGETKLISSRTGSTSTLAWTAAAGDAAAVCLFFVLFFLGGVVGKKDDQVDVPAAVAAAAAADDSFGCGGDVDEFIDPAARDSLFLIQQGT